MIALFAWELGAGRGHLEHIKPVLAALLNEGWSVVCAVRDYKGARSLLSDASGAQCLGTLDLIQAPIFTHFSGPFSRPPASIAEILAHIGFSDQSLLRPVVEDWSRIIETVRPDIIIGDFAPSVATAAQGQIPIIMTGNGWTIPPDGTPIPALPLRQYDAAIAREAERRICEAVEAVSGAKWRPNSFAQLLRGDACFIYTSSVLDPYRDWRRDELSCPPNLVIPDGWKRNSASHILLYLPRNHPSINRVLAAVGATGIKTYAYLGGSQPVSPPNVIIQPQPLDLPAMLPNAQLVVHHGGLGMANWCLAARKPQAVVPTDLEKSLIAHAIATSKSGVIISPNTSNMVGSIMRAKALPATVAEANFAHKTARETIQAIMQKCDALHIGGDGG